MSESKKASLSVIVPLYNEREIFPTVLKNLAETLDQWDGEKEILIVDDGSTDGFEPEIIRDWVRVVRHPHNMGNGAAVKTGIRAAKGDWCALMDADGQHDPREIFLLADKLDKYSLAVGARNFQTDGEPLRNMANRFYCLLAGYVAGVKINDLTSGFRAFHRKKALELIHLYPNGFSYPTTMTLGMIRLGYPVTFLPITVSERTGVSKINPMRDGIRFLLIILKIATLFSPLKLFVPIAAGMAGLGMLIYVYVLLFAHRFSLWSVVLLTNAITIFMMGLVAEEITSLKYKSPPADDQERSS